MKDEKLKQTAPTPVQETTVVLEPRLDVLLAGHLKGELSLLLDQKGPVLLDASRVTRISTAACQVMVAFVLAMRSLGRTVSFVSPSVQFMRTFAALGLAQFVTEGA